jgi:hypothetical protein
MFSDTFLLFERGHLVRLLLWAASSVTAGTAILALLAVRRDRSPLIEHFAIQSLAWGALELAFGAVAWRSLAERDLAAATRLDRLLWLNAGLELGYVAVGATLALTGWLLGRRLGAVGAGIGVMVQGLALASLDLIFVLRIDQYV